MYILHPSLMFWSSLFWGVVMVSTRPPEKSQRQRPAVSKHVVFDRSNERHVFGVFVTWHVYTPFERLFKRSPVLHGTMSFRRRDDWFVTFVLSFFCTQSKRDSWDILRLAVSEQIRQQSIPQRADGTSWRSFGEPTRCLVRWTFRQISRSQSSVYIIAPQHPRKLCWISRVVELFQTAHCTGSVDPKPWACKLQRPQGTESQLCKKLLEQWLIPWR